MASMEDVLVGTEASRRAAWAKYYEAVEQFEYEQAAFARYREASEAWAAILCRSIAQRGLTESGWEALNRDIGETIMEIERRYPGTKDATEIGTRIMEYLDSLY